MSYFDGSVWKRTRRSSSAARQRLSDGKTERVCAQREDLLRHRDPLFVKKGTVGRNDVDTPFAGIHALLAIRAIARRRIRLDSEIDILLQAAISVPSVMDADVFRSGNTRVEVQRASWSRV